MALLHPKKTRAFAVFALVTCIVACSNPSDQRAPGDSLVVIPATAEACSDCIILGDSVRIGSTQDSVIVAGVPRVAVDSHGRTYVADAIGVGKLIMVYDREGRFLGTLGTSGEGPGEYQVVWSIATGPADSLFVAVDWQKILVFSPDGKLAREIRSELGSPRFMVVLPDSRVLAVGSMYERAQEFFPIHLLDTDGRLIRSFGHESLNPPGDIAERLIALDMRGGGGGGAGVRAWIGERNNYRFDETDTTGRILRTIGAELPEDRVYINRAAVDSAIAAIPNVKPRPRPRAEPKRMTRRPQLNVGGAHVDSLGRMWVAVRTAVKNWRDLTPRYKQTSPDHIAYAEDFPLLLHDTSIDVIDLRSGRLIARRHLEGYGELTSDGRLVRVRLTGAGYVEISITSLELSR